MTQTRNEAIAEALRAIADEQDAQRRLLEQILQICRDTADGLSQHRQHTIQQVDDMGRTQRDHGRRLRRLEDQTGGE